MKIYLALILILLILIACGPSNLTPIISGPDTDTFGIDDGIEFSSARLNIVRGEEETQGLLIRNQGNSKLIYGVKFVQVECPEEWKIDNECRDSDSWFEYFKGGQKYEVNEGDRKISPIKVQPPEIASTGLYIFKIVAYGGTWVDNCPGDFDAEYNPDGCSIYRQTEFFLNVT